MLRLGYRPDYKGRSKFALAETYDDLVTCVDEALASGSLIAIDTETTGLDVNTGARMFMYSFSWLLDKGASRTPRVCPIGHGEYKNVFSAAVAVGQRYKGEKGKYIPEGKALEQLARLAEAEDVVMFNAKFDLKMLWADGVDVPNLQNDAYLDMFVIDPGFGDSIPEFRIACAEGRASDKGPLKRNLKDLCDTILCWPPSERDEVVAWLEYKFGKHKPKWKFERVPLDLITPYACGDTERTLCLCLWTRKLLKEREQVQLARDEAELTQCVATCELNGMFIHEEACMEARGEWLAKGDTAMDKMLEVTGLTHLEYGTDVALEGYAWPALNAQSSKKYRVPDGWSSDDLMPYVRKIHGKPMEAIKKAGVHGVFCKALLEKRLSDKLIGTYIDPWLNKHCIQHEDGKRIHPQLKQEGASTGRMACANPNLQNVPLEVRLFTAPEGRSLLFLDYSQIEYRVFAHYAGGSVLKAYQEDAEADFHQIVADMMGIERAPAKNINFGILFGMGKDKLIKSLSVLCGMSKDEATKIFFKYHEKFPMAKKLYHKCQERCRARGYIKNLFGRRRYLNEDHAHNAMNTIIQGGAADIIKRAMIRIQRALSNFPVEWGLSMHLQIHDELIFEVNQGYEKVAYLALKPLMEIEPVLQVPLIIVPEWCPAGVVWKDKKKLAA